MMSIPFTVNGVEYRESWQEVIMRLEQDLATERALTILLRPKAVPSQCEDATVERYKEDTLIGYAYFYKDIDGTDTIRFNGGREVNGTKPHRIEKIWLDSQLDRALTPMLEDARRQRAEIERLKNALDIATAGKYSALMLELAAGRAQQIHDALQVSILKAENEELRNALRVAQFKNRNTSEGGGA